MEATKTQEAPANGPDKADAYWLKSSSPVADAEPTLGELVEDYVRAYCALADHLWARPHRRRALAQMQADELLMTDAQIRYWVDRMPTQSPPPDQSAAPAADPSG